MPPPPACAAAGAVTSASWFAACAAALPKFPVKASALAFAAALPQRLQSAQNHKEAYAAATKAAMSALAFGSDNPFVALLRSLIASQGGSIDENELADALVEACRADGSKDAPIVGAAIARAETGGALTEMCKGLSAAASDFDRFVADEERAIAVPGALPWLSTKVIAWLTKVPFYDFFLAGLSF